MDIKPYERKTQYYETDKMGIIHHSNYIRWFEETRIDFMEQMGADYKILEDSGVIIPVLSVFCEYKSMVRFGDTVIINGWITEYTGTRMTVSYKIRDKKTGELRTLGTTKHCFLAESGRPVSLGRTNPYFDERFRASMKSSESKNIF